MSSQCFQLTSNQFVLQDYIKTSNTWSEADCGPRIKMIMPISGGLEKCKEECDADASCTAFEYAERTFNAKTDCCILRNCPLPIPTPTVVQANWHNGKFDYSGYASRNHSFVSI